MGMGVLRGFDRDRPVVVGERPAPVLAFGGRLAGAQRLGVIGWIAIDLEGVQAAIGNICVADESLA